MAVPASQLVFYGVRRTKGPVPPSDPAPSSYEYYEKPFRIPIRFTIAAEYNATLPLLAQGFRVQTQVNDFEFELRHITKVVHFIHHTVASPFAMILYDGSLVARSNAPVLAEYMCDDCSDTANVINGRNFWPAPGVPYRVNQMITLDIFTLLGSGEAGTVVDLLFDGVRRIPR